MAWKINYVLEMRRDGFYDLVLDGPGKNALGTAMMESILTRLDEAAGNPVRFSGAGDALSAGLDLKEIASLDRAAMTRFVELVDDVMARIFDYPGPTVACVNGHAIAGGCVVTLCCDLRVMTTDNRARIGLNEVALGLVSPPKISASPRAACPRVRSTRCCFAGPSTGRTTQCVSGSSTSSPRTRARRPRRESASSRPSPARLTSRRSARCARE